MPALLFHIAAIEELAEAPALLPPEVARALREDLEYARLGAALPDLPWYEGFRGSLGLLWPRREPPLFARLFHQRAPVAMGLKIAQLVASGALVGREPGLAFVCGYFSHFTVDRALRPLVQALAVRDRRERESLEDAHRRVEWTQALFHLERRYGRQVVGDNRVRVHFQLTKHRLPTAGVGRGLYELIRLASQDTLEVAPEKRQVDRWVQGAFLHGMVLGSPVGAGSRHLMTALSRRELYQGDAVDVPRIMEQALEQSRQVLRRVSDYIARGLFSRRARERFLADFPEGGNEACAA